MMTYVCHYNIIQSISTALKLLCTLPVRPSSNPLMTTDLFVVSVALPFPECPRVGIRQYVVFFPLLFSYNFM